MGPRSVLLVVLLQMASANPLGAQLPSCLALGSGTWTPSEPEARWTRARTLVLTDSLVIDEGGTTWRHATFADAQRRDEYDRAWRWAAPTADSLVILRPAILSNGMQVSGQWQGDTLKARASVFSDGARPGLPRANGYAIRFQCADSTAAANAFATLVLLRARDVPDLALGLLEDSIYVASWNRQRER